MEIILDIQSSVLHGSILPCFLTAILDQEVSKIKLRLDILDDYKELVYSKDFDFPKATDDEYILNVDTNDLEMHRFRQLFFIRSGVEYAGNWYYYPQEFKELTVYAEAETN